MNYARTVLVTIQIDSFASKEKERNTQGRDPPKRKTSSLWASVLSCLGILSLLSVILCVYGLERQFDDDAAGCLGCLVIWF